MQEAGQRERTEHHQIDFHGHSVSYQPHMSDYIDEREENDETGYKNRFFIHGMI